jgi:DNA-binding response OmpR family regulator
MAHTTPTFNDPLKSILIVDDDGVIVELLSIIFKKYGFKVFKAGNGLDAWDLFNNENIDFVLTDILMPGLNGKELSHRIRNQSSFTKIAVMTGGETDIANELLNNGIADYFFLKPFDIKNVCKMLTTEVRAA